MTKLPKDIRSALSPDSSMIDPKFKENLKVMITNGVNMANTQPKVSIFSMKHFAPLAGASLVLAGLVGVGSYMVSSNKSEKASLRAVELPTDLSGLKPMDEIRQLASIGAVEGISIASVELEQEEGVLVYKVKFSDGTYKLYDARTGEMVAKSDLEIDASVPADFVATVSIDTARATAQGVFPNKAVKKIELETENGVVVYSVRFTDDSRVDVSAVDGTVVRSQDGPNGGSDSSDDSNKDSDDSVDSEDHAEEDTEDDGDRSGSNDDKSGKQE